MSILTTSLGIALLAGAGTLLIIALMFRMFRRGGRDQSSSQQTLTLPEPKFSAILGLVLGCFGWFYPYPPPIYNQPVKAVVIKKLVSSHEHHGRSGSRLEYRPHLTVRYQVKEQSYESDCWVGPKDFWNQLFGGDYCASLEEAEQMLSSYSDGGDITVYYPSDHPQWTCVNNEIHVGERTFFFMGIFFILLSLLSLLSRQFKSNDATPSPLGNEDEIATDGSRWQQPHDNNAMQTNDDLNKEISTKLDAVQEKIDRLGQR